MTTDSNGEGLAVIVAARNEADRIGETVKALKEAFEGARIWVADDGSTDGTGDVALAAGAHVVRRKKPHGKGGNMTAAAEAMLSAPERPAIVMVCDGDLAGSAARLAPLVDAVESGRCDLSVAMFRRKVGGGFGVALGFARWAIRKRCGFVADAPISGQRAMRTEVLEDVLPFARGYGMEIGMTVDAVRAGHTVAEIELELSHRATGKTLSGFLHRGRQLVDFIRVYAAKRKPRR